MENKYCVYLHRRKSDNIPFYIGSGVQGDREHIAYGRTQAWRDFIRCDYFNVEYIHRDLTKSVSIELEREAIKHSTEILVNKREPVVATDIDYSFVSKYVKYDETSPTYLVWVQPTCNHKKIGDKAGCLTFHKVGGAKESGTVTIQGVKLKIHRVIWILFGNSIEDHHVIDHIDNNPHNNNIINLRSVPVVINGRNKKITKLDGLPIGISVQGGKYKHILANAVINGKTISKSFSIKKYTYELALSKAKSWRFSTLASLNGMGYGYTDNHITECDVIDTSHYTNSKYGVFGIFNQVVDGELDSVVSTIMFNGKKRYKSFYKKTYGTIELTIEAAKQFSTKDSFLETDFGKPIDLFIDSKLVKTYESSKIASEDTGVVHSSIVKCCKGKQRTTGGYQGNPIRTWKYHSN